jgi:hypothetical protein
MKYITLLSVLLLSAFWAAAQNYPSPTTRRDTNTPQTKSADSGTETSGARMTSMNPRSTTSMNIDNKLLAQLLFFQ